MCICGRVTMEGFAICFMGNWMEQIMRGGSWGFDFKPWILEQCLFPPRKYRFNALNADICKSPDQVKTSLCFLCSFSFLPLKSPRFVTRASSQSAKPQLPQPPGHLWKYYSFQIKASSLISLWKTNTLGPSQSHVPVATRTNNMKSNIESV